MQVLLLAALLGSSPLAASGSTQQSAVLAYVQQFCAAFNKGDIKTAIALCTPDVSIIDEFPPYEWHGPGSMTRWVNDFAADAKKQGRSGDKVTIGQVRHIGIVGDRAYVVYPASISFKLKGKPAGETGSVFTLALKKAKAGWQITAWTWSMQQK